VIHVVEKCQYSSQGIWKGGEGERIGVARSLCCHVRKVSGTIGLRSFWACLRGSSLFKSQLV
jgi:hypothetical protein